MDSWQIVACFKGSISNECDSIPEFNFLHPVRVRLGHHQGSGVPAIVVGGDGELITLLNKPLVSTSANISGEASPKSFKEISEGILKGVDYVVNLPDIKTDTRPSTIIKLNEDGNAHIIRE